MNIDDSGAGLKLDFGRSTDKITGLVILPITAIITFLLIYHLDRGIDLTDEGFYLVSASQAADLNASVTSFGVYTGFFLELFDRNIFLIRLAGLCFLIGLAIFFIESLMGNLSRVLGLPITVEKRIIHGCLAVLGILTYYQRWLVTPSYNLVALGACLLVGTGLIRIIDSVSSPKKQSFLDLIAFNSALVGMGYLIAIMSKPTTAMCLGIVTLLWIFFTDAKQQWLKIILYIASITLLLLALHVVFIEPSIASLLVRTLNGLEYIRLADMEHDFYLLLRGLFFEFLALPLKISRDLVLPAITFIALLIGSRLWLSQNPKYKSVSIEIIICIISMAACLILWAQGLWDGGTQKWNNSGYAGIALVLFVILTGYVSSLVFEKKIGPVKTTLALVLLNLSLPFCYGFGSNQGTITMSSMAYVFYACAIYICAIWINREYNFKIYLPLITSILVLSCSSMLYGAFVDPHRTGGSIFEQVTPVVLTNGATTIYTDTETATYINQLQSAAKKHQWQQGSMLIDMTGATPLASYLLDAKPVSVPWILGGYKGSNNAAYFALNSVNKKELKKAWILTCLECKRQISPDVLLRLGINLKADFRKVAQLKTSYRNEIQTLWKPRE